MSFPVKDYEAIKADILRDIANLLPEASIGDDSDWNVRASGVAAAIEGLYQYQAWIARQIMPDTADSDFLERHASQHGIFRKPPSVASGQALLSGSYESAIPSGTLLKSASGDSYRTTVDAAIGFDGTVIVLVEAVVAGLKSISSGAVLYLQSAPSGINGVASVLVMSSGSDYESDQNLLARLLLKLRNPPAGGNKLDYEQWALAVPGVAKAFCYPLRRGVGSVDVAILAGDGVPSTQLIADVTAFINDVRPVTASNFFVLAPTLVLVPVTASVVLRSGVVFATIYPLILSALQRYFNGLAPGEPVVFVQILMLMAAVDGVVDVALSSPSANVSVLVDAGHIELAALGAVSVVEV